MIKTILDVNVRLIDFHNNYANEMIIPNFDGSYTILINSRAATNKQLEAYEHALKHIKNDDFDKKDVHNIEISAHKKEDI